MPHTQPQGFLATPTTGKGPGVLVLHPWWGLNETIKNVCRRLAREGFTVFAPDLFHGSIATTIEEADALSSRHEAEQVKADIANAVAYLSERPELTGPELGVVGFSFGAYYALKLSGDDSERVRAVVLFYGTGDGEFKRSQAAYLGHFAGNDPYEPASSVDWLEKALRDAGRPTTIHRYEGTGHWFFEPDRSDAYNAAAATLAWERTVSFLKQTLPS